MNIDRAAEIGINVDPTALGGELCVDEHAPNESRWIVAQFLMTSGRVNDSLNNFRYDDAANEIYDFFWGRFCDEYVEAVKLRLDFGNPAHHAQTQEALTTLVQVFEGALRLLSPFMPFLTEELWHTVYENKEHEAPARSIALTAYPEVGPEQLDFIYSRDVTPTVNAIKIQTAIRALKKNFGASEGEVVPAEIYLNKTAQGLDNPHINLDLEMIGHRARASVSVKTEPLNSPKIHSEAEFDVAIIYEREIDVPAERERLTKEIAKLEKNIASAERQLGNDAFLAKAPAAIVEGLKKQGAENRLLLEKAKAALAALPEA